MGRLIRRNGIRRGCWVLLLLLGMQSDEKAQEVAAPKRHEVTIPNTELRTIRSQIVDQVFNIYIQLPANYASDTAATYPALYVTDANRSFPMVANISSVLAVPKTNLPEIIVVGIGYPINDMADWAAWRTRDLTPTNDTSTDNYWNRLLSRMSGRRFDVRSGGASKFMDFIIHELIPFMEPNYRISQSDRGLAGYSYGGLFALYALFAHPETFTRVFAGSPSVEYDSGSIFRLENSFTTTGNGLEAKVFMTVGGLEDSSTIAGVKKMSAVLQSRFSPGVHVSTHFFEGEDHRSCMPAAFMRAFKVLYGK